MIHDAVHSVVGSGGWVGALLFVAHLAWHAALIPVVGWVVTRARRYRTGRNT